MAGVVSKVPRGWRNIQAVNIKTVHSISLPVYNSLPPEPKLLPGIEEISAEPKTKRVKLEAVEPSLLPPVVDITGSSGKSGSKRRGVAGKDPTKKREGGSLVGGEEMGDALFTTPALSGEGSGLARMPAAPPTPVFSSQKKKPKVLIYCITM